MGPVAGAAVCLAENHHQHGEVSIGEWMPLYDMRKSCVRHAYRTCQRCGVLGHVSVILASHEFMSPGAKEAALALLERSAARMDSVPLPPT